MTECTDRNRTQLNDRGNDFAFHNKPTAAVDCNVAAVSLAVEIKTGKQMTALDCRTVAGEPNGPSGTRLARKVLTSAGLVQGADFTTFANADVQDVRDLLHAGAHVVVFVGYGALIDNANGRYASSKTFRGWHAVGLCGLWVSGRARTWLYDPLADGRTRSGHTYPFGRQRVPFRIMREAMGLYAGPGRASGYAVLP